MIVTIFLLIAIAFCFNMAISSKVTGYLIIKEGDEEEKAMAGLYVKNNNSVKNDTAAMTVDHEYVTSDSSVFTTITLSPTLPPTLSPTLKPVEKSSMAATTTKSSSNVHTVSWFDESQMNSSGSNNGLPPMIPNVSAVFTERWCDLTGVEWYPSDRSSHKLVRSKSSSSQHRAWQQRVPALLLPGAKYSGTQDIATWLETYTSSLPTKVIPARARELQFFYEANFRRYVTPFEQKTKVLPARARMYARDYNQAVREITRQQQQNENSNITALSMSLDATSGYLFASSILPRRILCVMPWVKLVIVLRDPVDRIAEQYAILKRRGLKLDLESWIDKDLALMQSTGLLQNKTNSNQFAASAEEDIAWYDYQTTTVEGAVGRSIYCIQLRHWFQALRAAGRDPSRDVHIVRTEDLQAQPNVEFAGILDFLQLPSVQLPATISLKTIGNRTDLIMKPETRQRLDEFFRPYNRRLLSLVKRYNVPFGAKSRRRRSINNKI